jgi:hypothetical protein
MSDRLRRPLIHIALAALALTLAGGCTLASLGRLVDAATDDAAASDTAASGPTTTDASADAARE